MQRPRVDRRLDVLPFAHPGMGAEAAHDVRARSLDASLDARVVRELLRLLRLGELALREREMHHQLRAERLAQLHAAGESPVADHMLFEKRSIPTYPWAAIEMTLPL